MPSHLNVVVKTTKISKAFQATQGNPPHGAATLSSQFSRVSRVYFFKLHWTSGLSHALRSTALHFTAFHCTAFYCTELHVSGLHWTLLHCTLLPCTLLHFTALHWTALLHCCTTLHCTALNCTARAPENLKLAGNWPKVAAMCGLKNYLKKKKLLVSN